MTIADLDAQLAIENDPEARRKAARERELKADLENARGLFGDDAVEAIAPSSGKQSSSLLPDVC